MIKSMLRWPVRAGLMVIWLWACSFVAYGDGFESLLMMVFSAPWPFMFWYFTTKNFWDGWGDK